MFDVFYSGKKPGIFSHEREADNIEHAQQLSRTRYFWWINYLADLSRWDWLWEPTPWQAHQRHAWPSQHQDDAGVYLVPKAGYTETNYRTDAVVPRVAAAIYEIDHADGNAGLIPNAVKTVRYFDNYLDTLKRLVKSIPDEQEFVWVCSSICDYTNFDFTWHPNYWQSNLLHVFRSNEEKFGDTFFMHVPSFKKNINQCELLDWYGLNFVEQSVPRRPIPVVHHSYDSQADAVRAIEFTGPLALFTTEEHMDQPLVTVPLWRKEVKTITPISKGATAVIVPKVAVGDICTQLYDYPNINKTKIMLKSQPLDIVFISNGEVNAEQNYRWLIVETKANMNSNLNKIHRVDGVNGRVAAYHAAAQASTTPWFFAVFAKLEVNQDFDWTWQPDRMQQPKHYIFHACNPVNGLEYGHQAMIAYNKKLVLENTGLGLDFTLDQPHEVVPIVSGTAHYHTSDWMCWRTAFREALKLQASLPDVENEYRLQQWLAKDNTAEQWSLKGAQDAVEYYDSVGGNFDELKKSYEWDWLASYAFMKRGLAPNQ